MEHHQHNQHPRSQHHSSSSSSSAQHHQTHQQQPAQEEQSSSGSSPIGMLSTKQGGSGRRRNASLLGGVAGFSPPVTPHSSSQQEMQAVQSQAQASFSQSQQQQQASSSSSSSSAAFANIANGPIAVPAAPPSFIGTTVPQIKNIFALGNSGASANGVSTGISALQAMSAIPTPTGGNGTTTGRPSLSPGAKRNSIPLPNLPVTPSTPNGTTTNFAHPNERVGRSALWVLLHGQDDGLRNYQNQPNFPNNFRPDQHHMLPQDPLLRPDDLTSLVLSEHIINDNNDSNQGMRYPMMQPLEPQPGTVDPTFTVPEWPRTDMSMEARNFPAVRNGLPDLPSQMFIDGRAAGGILSPPAAFTNLPNNFFKMESNPYNSLDFNMLNNYPTLDGQTGSAYPMDGIYNPYTAGLYENNNPYAEPYDCMGGYGSQAPFNASLIAQAQKPKQPKGAKKCGKKKGPRNANKSSWTEDASGGANNSKRLRRNWTDEEERKFSEALEMYGRDWHKCAAYLQTRDVVSCRSHAQKYFIKLWMSKEPLPKKVAEQGAGYTVSGKPLDPNSSFVKYYVSLFEKRRNSSKPSTDE
eukprot:TRINITY_DN26001_c0_g1_i5.p1 TRINITY_DN26001_c0_g1~~TRINITY_DN26001_c0_g1_i5.p1  ORF type:complete len:579 (-),score=118.71 TRINITY_DN26001_c0_g1_i5:124-1860(-)